LEGRPGSRAFYIQPLQARRLVDLIGLRVAPAATAGVIAYGHVGDIGEPALLFAAVLAATSLLDRVPYALHLMPVGWLALSLGAPLLAAGLLLAIASSGGSDIGAAELIPPALGAFPIALLGHSIQVGFDASRPVRVAVIGSAALARSLARELRVAGVEGYAVVGWLSAADRGADRVNGIERLGALRDLRSAVISHHIELLVLDPGRNGGPAGKAAQGEDSLLKAEEAATACLDLPVRMLDANQLYEELLGHVPIGTIDAAWFRYIMHPRYRPTPPLSKRVLDVALASMAGLVVLPAVAIAAAAIKLESRGPVLYRQRRVGANGREFEILKLRTMPPDAEPDGSPQWSSAADQRVTRVGRVLRRFHVDELPQLWNVLRGEMTLVGPRPERPELVAGLERQFPHYERRHLVKPGITGWAQIRCGYAGSEMGAAWKLCHDLYYLKHRSLLADVLLMVETAALVVRPTERKIGRPDEHFVLGDVRAAASPPR
jgi:exopolysaccharide biosynthesis polyprenyl glycosylphosphotransferase